MSVLKTLSNTEKRLIRRAIRKKTTSMVVIDSSSVDGEVLGYATYICSTTKDMVMLNPSDNDKPGLITFVNLKAICNIPSGKREKVYIFKDKLEVTCYEQDRA